MADSILFMVIEKNNNSCTHKYKLYMATSPLKLMLVYLEASICLQETDGGV